MQAESDTPVIVKDNGEDDNSAGLSELGAFIEKQWFRASTLRRTNEERWIRAYYNFRGLYGKEIQFTDSEKSRAFVKITKTKTLAAYGQIIDVLFGTGKVPITVEEEQIPRGIDEIDHIDVNDPTDKDQQGDQQQSDQSVLGFPGDGNDLQPGDTLMAKIGTFLASQFKGAKVKPGPALDNTAVEIHPAEVAAKRMEKKIQDQLDEAKAMGAISSAVLEMVVFGSGVVKGPMNINKEYPKWDQETGEYTPLVKTIPDLSYVSVWACYPDPEAFSALDMGFMIERHRFTKSQLRALKKRPFFMEEAIDDAIEDAPNWVRQWWEFEIDDNQVRGETQRYEVLEYWGTVDRDMLEDFDIDIPPELESQEEFEINAWKCGSHILRVVLNPFTPRRIPYAIVPYETNPYNIFGVGLAENMEDLQTLMNGFTRLAIDNAVLSANIMLEVDESNLSPGQDMKVSPGKIWRRNSGPPGQAIFAIKWPNTIQENMQMFDRFRQMTDEATGIPSFSHGSTGVMSTGRTAAGMSMLMGAAALNIKTVIKNLDEYLLRPLGDAMFAWNMQFDFDPTLKGNLAVKARGTASLMSREVKSQRILQLLQIASNPAIAPLVKFPTLIKEYATTLDLDPDKLINDPAEAKVMAELMGLAGGTGQPQQPGQAPGGPQEFDETGRGDGNIGVGVTAPGTPGFSGNTEQQTGPSGGQQQP